MHPNDHSPRVPDRSRGGPRSEDGEQFHAAVPKQILRSTVDSVLYLGPQPPPAAFGALDLPENEMVFARHPPAPATFFQPETSRTLAHFFRPLRIGVRRVIREWSTARLRLRCRLPFSIGWVRVLALAAFSSLVPRATPGRLFSPGPRPRSILRDLHASHVINVFRGRSLLRRFRGLPPKSTGSCER